MLLASKNAVIHGAGGAVGGFAPPGSIPAPVVRLQDRGGGGIRSPLRDKEDCDDKPI